MVEKEKKNFVFKGKINFFSLFILFYFIYFLVWVFNEEGQHGVPTLRFFIVRITSISTVQ